MEINGLTNLSTALTQAKTGDEVAIKMQKKAMDLQAEAAAQLIESLPQPNNNPPHLGQNVDIKA